MQDMIAAIQTHGRAMQTTALKRMFRGLLILVFILATLPLRAASEETSDAAEGGADFSRRITTRLTLLSYGVVQDAAASSQNPGYLFLDLPVYQGDLEARPDIYMDLKAMDISLKPRFTLQWQSGNHNDTTGTSQWDSDGYINEWLARLRICASLFLSYGRENLQWGPSYLLSPSNPFFDDNGRSNPKQEVAGMDFARLVWLPDANWTLSLIANTGPGRQTDAEASFEQTCALKVDYVGQSAYGGTVLSHRNADRTRLGFYGGVTASDAILLYAEGSLARGTAALYPVADAGVSGATLIPTRDDSDALESLLLFGGAYTLEMGPTLTLEYVYNSSGYDRQASECFYRLRDTAAEALVAGGPGQGPAAELLGRTADPGLRLLRRNYLMVQYGHNDIGDALNLLFRWTRNLDDGGSRFIAMADYFVDDHLSLFLVGTLNFGGSHTEFGSFMDRQWMLGAQYSF
jgi:hypothetical protein